MPIDLDVLVLPAFDDLPGLPGEATPWHDSYDLDEAVHIEGVPSPVRHTAEGLGVVPTGVGKSAAATTTTALCASDELSLEDTLVLTVGVAGGPPDLALGSVVIAETVVDWDDKCRLDPGDSDPPLAMNPYTEGHGSFALDSDLVEDALSTAETVELATDPSVATPGEDGPTPEADEPAGVRNETAPTVVTGTNLCGDELWHGRAMAEQAAWVVDQYDAGPYRATEMEDAGTAAALERFGLLDQYLSIRGISNYDRPAPGVSARESFFDPTFEGGFELGIENAVSVARALVEPQLA